MKRFRLSDYVVVFILDVIYFGIQLINIDVISIFKVLLGATIMSLIIGSITNFIFKKSDIK